MPQIYVTQKFCIENEIVQQSLRFDNDRRLEMTVKRLKTEK